MTIATPIRAGSGTGRRLAHDDETEYRRYRYGGNVHGIVRQAEQPDNANSAYHEKDQHVLRRPREADCVSSSHAETARLNQTGQKSPAP